MNGLLRGATKSVQLITGRCDRKPRLERGKPSNAGSLFPDWSHASGHHIFYLGFVQPDSLHQSIEGTGQQIHRVNVAECATWFTAADRCPNGVDENHITRRHFPILY